MLIVDMGPLVAIADTDDEHYAKCLDVLEAAHGPFVTQSSRVTLVELVDAGWEWVIDLVGIYRSQSLGTVDASIVAVAERRGVIDIASFNGRDFWTVRPRHCGAFTLLTPRCRAINGQDLNDCVTVNSRKRHRGAITGGI